LQIRLSNKNWINQLIPPSILQPPRNGLHFAAVHSVEKPASLGFFDNKRKKDAAAAAAL
jgi:hypothetical protein